MRITPSIISKVLVLMLVVFAEHLQAQTPKEITNSLDAANCRSASRCFVDGLIQILGRFALRASPASSSIQV